MTESPAPVVLADLPYAERQLIVVVADAMVAAEREAEGKAEPGNGGASWVAIAKLAALPVAGVAGYAVASAVEAALAAARARDSGVDVLTVASTEAASLTFQPGHPRAGVLYVGHPAVPTTYYAAAGFHRHTFEHKFAEAVGLVMALGATQLEVEHVKGWSDQFAADLGVTLPVAGAEAEAGLHAKQSRSHGSSALFKATLKGSGRVLVQHRLLRSLICRSLLRPLRLSGNVTAVRKLVTKRLSHVTRCPTSMSHARPPG